MGVFSHYILAIEEGLRGFLRCCLPSVKVVISTVAEWTWAHFCWTHPKLDSLRNIAVCTSRAFLFPVRQWSIAQIRELVEGRLNPLLSSGTGMDADPGSVIYALFCGKTSPVWRRLPVSNWNVAALGTNENVCLRYGSMSAFDFFEIILNRVVASLSLFTMCLALDCIQELYAFPYKYHLLASSVGFTRSYLLVTFFYGYTPVSLD